MKYKVILFGAGDGGLRVSYLLNDSYEVIAFADNEESKHGQTLLSKLIIHPDEIINYDYDFVIISNIHGESVYNQLTQQLGVPQEKIIDHYMSLKFDVRLAMLRQAADEIYENSISGQVAELGVYQGEYAKYINDIFHDRKLYLFDTFEGFTSEDISKEEEYGFSDSKVKEFSNTSIDTVLSKMKNKENCIVREGYFPDTAQDIEEVFSFVSIDVDLFNPIYEGLAYFYPRMSQGGYIFIHDYNSTRFHGVKEAVRKYCKENHVRYVPMSDLCGSVVIIK